MLIKEMYKEMNFDIILEKYRKEVVNELRYDFLLEGNKHYNKYKTGRIKFLIMLYEDLKYVKEDFLNNPLLLTTSVKKDTRKTIEKVNIFYEKDNVFKDIYINVTNINMDSIKKKNIDIDYNICADAVKINLLTDLYKQTPDNKKEDSYNRTLDVVRKSIVMELEVLTEKLLEEYYEDQEQCLYNIGDNTVRYIYSQDILTKLDEVPEEEKARYINKFIDEIDGRSFGAIILLVDFLLKEKPIYVDLKKKDDKYYFPIFNNINIVLSKEPMEITKNKYSKMIITMVLK